MIDYDVDLPGKRYTLRIDSLTRPTTIHGWVWQFPEFENEDDKIREVEADVRRLTGIPMTLEIVRADHHDVEFKVLRFGSGPGDTPSS